MPQPKIYSFIDKAIFDYNMIPQGAKLLVGASGGKDSTLLLEYLANRLKRRNRSQDGTQDTPPFTLGAVYIKTDFAEDFNPVLLEKIRSWGVDVETLYVNTLERVKPGHKMSCYWCSTQRRKELLAYAMEHGYDTIVLGHHLDDILETLIMNMLHGTMLGMPPSLQYEKYPVRIIRPLSYIPVDMIKQHAQEAGWKSVTCTCTYQDNSGRKDARRRLEALTDGDNGKKKLILQALQSIESKLCFDSNL